MNGTAIGMSVFYFLKWCAKGTQSIFMCDIFKANTVVLPPLKLADHSDQADNLCYVHACIW